MDVRSRSKRPVYADVVETQRAIRSVKHANLKAAVGLAIFGSALAYFSEYGDGPAYALIMIAVAVAYYLVQLIAWIWYRRRPALLTAYTVTVDPDAGVTMRSELGASHVPWSGFDRIIETRNLFMLSGRGTRNGAYMTVPKRSMSTSEVDRTRALLGARIGAPLARK